MQAFAKDTNTCVFGYIFKSILIKSHQGSGKFDEQFMRQEFEKLGLTFAEFKDSLFFACQLWSKVKYILTILETRWQDKISPVLKA